MRVPININLPKMKSGGEFRLWTHNPDGSIGDDTGWFPNLVTDVGLVNMTTVFGWADRFHIGSSGSTPLFTDTALNAWLASSTTVPTTDINVNLGASDYQGQTTRTRRFDPGSTRTVREIGVNNVNSNTDMTIHTLVTPEIVQSDQQILDASYRFTTWPNLTDGTGIVNIAGDDYDYTVRMSEVDLFKATFEEYRPRSIASSHSAYTGNIGTVTESPTGSISGGATSVIITSQGSGFCNYTVLFGIDQANDALGIRSIRSQLLVQTDGSQIYIQVEFSNRGEGVGALGSTIPKNNTREISFDMGLTWERHV